MKQHRFVGRLQVVALRDEYERRYADSRHDVRFNPDAGSHIAFELHIGSPGWMDDATLAEIEKEIGVHARNMAYAVQRIASERFAKQQDEST